MKAIEIRDNFGVDAGSSSSAPNRCLGLGQVPLKMKAFSINYRALLVVDWRRAMEDPSRACSAV